MSSTTLVKKMTTEEKRELVLSELGTDGVTVSEIKDKIDGHAGRTALLFTAMCRSGLLEKTENKRDGKVIYVKGDGKPHPTKKVEKPSKPKKAAAKKTTKAAPKTKPKAAKKTPAKITTSKRRYERKPKSDRLESAIVEAARKEKSTKELDAAVDKAHASGVAVGHNLMEAKRQIDAFIAGLRESLGG